MKCNQCDSMYINGVFCHERGCSVEREERLQAEQEERESEEPEPFFDDCPTCPICDGESESLGTLGAIAYYRCIDCGMDFKE